MERNVIIEKLTVLARYAFGKADLILTDDMSSANVDTWTSLSFMSFLTAIEREFGIKFKIADLLRMQSIGDIVDVISDKCSNEQ